MTKTPSLSKAALLLFTALVGSPPAQADDPPLFYWGQLVPGKESSTRAELSIRAIVPRGAPCPNLYVGTASKLALTPTSRTPPANFQEIMLCEALVSHKDPLVGGFAKAAFDPEGKTPFNLPDLTHGVPLSSMASFGCTGCRQDKDQPDCSDAGWAYKAVTHDANQQTLASGMPPVVVHLGDIRYAGEKTQPDSWTLLNGNLGWQEEFFTPSQSLLAAGWWIVMRGNHEACMTDPDKSWQKVKKDETLYDRGAAWFYFFDAGNNSCTQALEQNDVMPAYALDATYYSHGQPVKGSGVRLVVMDTVRTGDSRDKEPEESAKLYGQQFDAVEKNYVKTLGKNQPFWLFTHIPMASTSSYKFNDTVVMDGLNRSDLAKSMPHSPLTVAAHHHEFELINPQAGNPTDQGPVQYVMGNGGVALSGHPEYEETCKRLDISWSPLDGSKKMTATWVDESRPNFGYLLTTLDISGAGQLTPRFYDLANQTWTATDATVNCMVQADGQVYCPYLPEDKNTPHCP